MPFISSFPFTIVWFVPLHSFISPLYTRFVRFFVPRHLRTSERETNIGESEGRRRLGAVASPEVDVLEDHVSAAARLANRPQVHPEAVPVVAPYGLHDAFLGVNGTVRQDVENLLARLPLDVQFLNPGLNFFVGTGCDSRRSAVIRTA